MMCGYNAGSFMRTTAGCAAFSWCVCLFLFTGIFCCWVPFCIPTCMDHEIVCARCGYIKGVIEAQCCWWIEFIIEMGLYIFKVISKGWVYSISSKRMKPRAKPKTTTRKKKLNCQSISHSEWWNYKCKPNSKNLVILRLSNNSTNCIE